MAEKADLPSDTVSLPPTYAPSESFTESPPPAYRKPGMAAVRVARIVCCTLLAMTFMVGFFVVMHKWVQNRDCKCAMDEVASVRHAALFAQAPNQLNSDLNNNKIEETISERVPGKLMNEESVEREDDFVPEEQIIDNEESVEESNDVNLPKDLLLGNPKLAGRNVHCKVEKRQRKIAEGIMTQAIIVTCDDDDDDNEEVNSDEENDDKPMLNIVPLRPPMSLLSNIMKVLSSRPRSMNRDRDEPPRMIPFPLRSPPPPPHGHMPMRGPFPGPFQGPVSPIFVPLRKIEMRRPHTESEEANVPLPFLRGPPPPFMSEERPPPMQHRPMPPPPMRFLQRPDETNERRVPFPFPSGPVPIRIIRLPQRDNGLNEEENEDVMPQEEENEGPMPFPVHPLIKLFPARRRIIRLRPKQSLDNIQSLENGLPFPFPRGALPPRFPEEQEVPHPMPEATGRALPAPVALPGVRVLRLPFRPQPLPFPDAKLITHMEVREPSEEEEKPQELQNTFQPPNLPENQSFRLNNKEFGPPKIHTVLENLPQPIFHQEEQQEEDSPLLDTIHHEPITQTQSQPRVLAPPPPRFALEGRTSILAQLNPDAEVIRNIEETDRPRPAIHQVVLN